MVKQNDGMLVYRHFVYTKCFQEDDREVQKSKVVVYNANKIRTEKSESIVNVDAESTVKLGESKDRIRKGSDKGKKSFVMQGSRNIA